MCDRAVPWIAVAAPVVCYVLKLNAPQWLGYHFGFEILLLNGLITFLLILCFPLKNKKSEINIQE